MTLICMVMMFSISFVNDKNICTVVISEYAEEEYYYDKDSFQGTLEELYAYRGDLIRDSLQDKSDELVPLTINVWQLFIKHYPVDNKITEEIDNLLEKANSDDWQERNPAKKKLREEKYFLTILKIYKNKKLTPDQADAIRNAIGNKEIDLETKEILIENLDYLRAYKGNDKELIKQVNNRIFLLEKLNDR